ncbi:MAG: fumarylacetoacetate hydrolase family protein [Candidatus Binatia bacterium]|jgi:2-keto-4-pentenoate hydratase/2-oxohepta-3-ene-1,7-dioic acid hydratase in catechol pathway
MKVVTFERNGVRSYGILENDRVLDVGNRLASRYADLRAVLAAGALQELLIASTQGPQTFQVEEVNFEPVIPNPQKILCVGLNYISHRTETKRPETKYPSIFTRFADTQVGHETPVLRPSFSTAFDYEGELAVVIGRRGRHISEQDVSAHIAGYSCYNDVSVRDWQRHTAQWTPGKNFPSTGAFGPSLVTPDEIPDLGALTLTTRLNGKVMQEAPISDLIFSVPVIVSYISKFTPLYPGDVIATGTPGGVGDRRDPPVYMKDGDIVEVEIDRIGILRNVVQSEAHAGS